MSDLLNRFWDELIGRADGPLTLRLFLQPIMASIFAIRSGIKDAREGRPPFLWSLVHQPADRPGLLQSAWKDIGKIFVIAIVLDAVYQIISIHAIRPLQLVLVPCFLALVPYLVARGLVARIAGLIRKEK